MYMQSEKVYNLHLIRHFPEKCYRHSADIEIVYVFKKSCLHLHSTKNTVYTSKVRLFLKNDKLVLIARLAVLQIG